MANYSASNFIRTYAGTDKAIQIQNTYGQKIFTLNVCNYQKSFVYGINLVVSSEDGTKEYRLDFASGAEALTAQTNLRTAVDTLIGNCDDSQVVVITNVTTTPITYSQYKSLQASDGLSALTWYDVSDTLNALNIGAVIRVFCKATNDYQPEGMVLSTGALVTLNVIDDEVQRFELSSQKILALNKSRISYDGVSSKILAENDSTITVANSNNVTISNSSLGVLTNCNYITIRNDSNVTMNNASAVEISGIVQNLTTVSIGFSLSNVQIDTNTTTGKSGKTTTNIASNTAPTLQAYSSTIDQEFLFTVDNTILDVKLDNKITQANGVFRLKLLLDSGINDCKINVRDKNNVVLYTATDIHNDSWLWFEFNKTTQLFEFIRIDAPEITAHKIWQTTSTAAQTTFILPYVPTDATKLAMHVNGVRLKFGSHFTFASPNVVTYNAIDYTLGNGDEIEFIIY